MKKNDIISMSDTGKTKTIFTKNLFKREEKKAMFISKKEFNELKEIKKALHHCENVENLNLWKIQKTINTITRNAENRKERAKNIFIGSFITLFFATMFFFGLNGYSFIIK